MHAKQMTCSNCGEQAIIRIKYARNPNNWCDTCLGRQEHPICLECGGEITGRGPSAKRHESCAKVHQNWINRQYMARKRYRQNGARMIRGSATGYEDVPDSAVEFCEARNEKIRQDKGRTQ